MSTALQTRDDFSRIKTMLAERADDFRAALPGHIAPEKFQRTIMTAVQSNPDLIRADRASLITACYKAAQDGLLPDGREAALVTFKTRKKDAQGAWHDHLLVQYMPMVYGIRKKILQSGEIRDIQTAVVYRQEIEAGLFIYEEGTERVLRHKPLLDPSFDPTDDDIAAAYSVATTTDGDKSFEVMTRRDINKVRQASQTGAVGRTDRQGRAIAPKGPWVDWFSEMARKTVMRRHSKTLPMSGDIIDIEAMDERQASISAVNLLASAQPEAPQLSEAPPTRAQFEVDPETGEVTEGPSDETEQSQPAEAFSPSAGSDRPVDPPPQESGSAPDMDAVERAAEIDAALGEIDHG